MPKISGVLGSNAGWKGPDDRQAVDWKSGRVDWNSLPRVTDYLSKWIENV
jgi:hypothetical protein